MTFKNASHLANQMAEVLHLEPGARTQLAKADSKTNTLLGDIGIFIEKDLPEAETGITVCKENQNIGCGSNALGAALSLLHNLPNIKSIRAITETRNFSSIKLLEKLGFSKIKEHPALFKGLPCTEIFYKYTFPDSSRP